jgi:hypothetical protein
VHVNLSAWLNTLELHALKEWKRKQNRFNSDTCLKLLLVARGKDNFK